MWGNPAASIKKSDNDATLASTEDKSDPVAVLGQLKKMLDDGFIDQADYDKKKAEVLSRM